VGSVVDPHDYLDAANARVLKVPRNRTGSVWFELAVSVNNPNDYVFALDLPLGEN
jgi:hypothetical protein